MQENSGKEKKIDRLWGLILFKELLVVCRKDYLFRGGGTFILIKALVAFIDSLCGNNLITNYKLNVQVPDGYSMGIQAGSVASVLDSCISSLTFITVSCM